MKRLALMLLMLPQLESAAPAPAPTEQGKPVIYQMFTRLFGNKNSTNKPWGTIKQNGVGKFSDINDNALAAIKAMGVKYIWYTGVPEHAQVTDYSAFGIAKDDPDVVKGRAGSPYAVKDYYNVDPDLANDPTHRLQEFEALIRRTHAHGMKVIMDIVPNHVARRYHSSVYPDRDFGLHDDTSVVYKRNNNFYYVVGKAFKVPKPEHGYKPVGGDPTVGADGKFAEYPAKWTGNGSRKAQPDFNDWYETVKINYGVRPDGSHDFPSLPASYAHKDYRAHYAFWQGKSVPDSWVKFRQIALYWLAKGVDGFRYDMAGMVPVEFWSYLNSAIKMKNPKAVLIAEIYRPSVYQDYIHLGQMDYLYDKVDTYDTVRAIMTGKAGTGALVPVIQRLAGVDGHLVRFLENHDEQRIASSGFAGNAAKGKPGMVVTALLGKGPAMIYFGQSLGEPAKGDAGFGKASRTTMFDYWGVPTVQRWMDGGRFDGGKLTASEKALHQFYSRLLNIAAREPAMKGPLQELYSANKGQPGFDDKVFAFARWQGHDRLLVASNFDVKAPRQFTLKLPAELMKKWQLADGQYPLKVLLGKASAPLLVSHGQGKLLIQLPPLGSVVLKV